MQRKFLSNLIFVLFLNLLIKPFWILGIDRTVQNTVGEYEYGFYYPLFSFTILFNILLDFGITNYNNRNIAQHGHMLKRYFSGIFNVKLVLGFVYLLVTIIAGLIIGYDSKELQLLFILCINQFLSSLILYLRSNLTGLLHFKSDGLLSILDRVIMIGICGVLLWGNVVGEFQIEWFVYAQLIAYLLTAIVGFLLVYREVKFFKVRVDYKLFRIVLKESLPFALLVLLMSFYYRLDSIMIKGLLDNGRFEAGIYAKSYRLLEGFNMFGYLFASLLLPLFSRMLKEKKSIEKLVNLSFNLIFLPSIAVAVISWIYATEIMELLYYENITQSAKVYGVLMFSFIAIALTYVYGTLLTANGSLKQLNIISLIGLVLNIILNYVMIPTYGAYGAALATLITQIIVVISQIIIAKKILTMSYSLGVFVKNGFVISLAIITSYYVSSYLHNWMVSSIIILFVFVFLSLILRIFRLSELKKLLKSRAE